MIIVKTQSKITIITKFLQYNLKCILFGSKLLYKDFIKMNSNIIVNIEIYCEQLISNNNNINEKAKIFYYEENMLHLTILYT